jgi:hypothetical protein
VQIVVCGEVAVTRVPERKKQQRIFAASCACPPFAFHHAARAVHQKVVGADCTLHSRALSLICDAEWRDASGETGESSCVSRADRICCI